MMAKLTEEYFQGLKLIQRSIKENEEWVKCSKPAMDQIVSKLPSDLVEISGLEVKLTEKAITLLEWL